MSAQVDCYQVGTARVDITPRHSIRLSGYGDRREETTDVVGRLWAKALVIASDVAEPFVLVTADLTGVPEALTEEVASRLKRRGGIARERFALSVTHTHTAPMVDGYLPNLFGMEIQPEHRANISRYTRFVVDSLEAVALEALDSLEPATLGWEIGRASFATNRRDPSGPVDHDLPLLSARAEDGTLRAAVASYACHCTTLRGKDNFVCGDWAGFAAELVESQHPGAVCLMTIGCGADANPHPRPGLDRARLHGRTIADEICWLLGEPARPIRSRLRGRFERLELPFAALPTREELTRRARRDDAVGFHAGKQLARLHRGEALKTRLRYPLQTWTFGDELGLVFLAGEVVSDYSLRLKRELDRRRLWVHAYTNDVPCYIPSRRVLAEGGYEGEGAMTYYNQPGPLDASVEDLIVGAVHALLPESYAADAPQDALFAPRTPQAVRRSIDAVNELLIERVVGEAWTRVRVEEPTFAPGIPTPRRGGRLRSGRFSRH